MSDAYDGKCFVIQPFDRGTFDKRYKDVFEPAIRSARLEPYRVDQDLSVNILIEEIERGITQADACFAEITTDNPNVWFEVGYALASSKPLCLICSTERTGPFPFDVRHRNILRYDVASPSDFDNLAGDITVRITALMEKQRGLETIASLKPTSDTRGLSPHEVAVLTMLLAEFDRTGMTSWQLKQDMKQAGYTEIAAGLAIERLRRSRMIEQDWAEDNDGDRYPVWTLSDSGTNWLLENETQLKLRTQEFNPNHIPF